MNLMIFLSRANYCLFLFAIPRYNSIEMELPCQTQTFFNLLYLSMPTPDDYNTPTMTSFIEDIKKQIPMAP